jgi:hypothetical protein
MHQKVKEKNLTSSTYAQFINMKTLHQAKVQNKENFISGTNELLLPTTQGYDERLKFSNLRNFLNVIESLCKISLGK